MSFGEWASSLVCVMRGGGLNGSLTLITLGGMLMVASLLDGWSGILPDAGVIAVASALALSTVGLWRSPESLLVTAPPRPRGPYPEGLVSTAMARLDEMTYQKTLETGWSNKATGKLTAGPAEIGAEAALTGARSLAEIALTFPESVARLRAFLTQAVGSEVPSGKKLHVRIGIDELDKMESEEVAHRFLNEIKGVFGIPRCHFLVSVSEEALSNFDRRGAHLRDAFDSAFDEIMYVQPLRFTEARALLAQRVIGLSVPYQALCHVLSGGLPRDLIRVARTVVAAKPDTHDGRLGQVVSDLISIERDRRVRALSVAGANFHQEPDAGGFLRWTRLVQGVEITAPAITGFCEGKHLLSTKVDDGVPLDEDQHSAREQLTSSSWS